MSLIELAEGKPRPIIVKKVIPPATEAHHGGAWKIAYADFVTAMMAFFLVMWIVGATSEDQRKGIADYFRPTLANQSAGGGADGLLAGRSPRAEDGTNVSDARALTDINNGIDRIERSLHSLEEAQFQSPDDDNLLQDVRNRLIEILAASPTLSGMMDRFEVHESPAGVHIELIDSGRPSMFPIGSAATSMTGNLLVDVVSEAIADTTNPIVIRGHTDGRRFEGEGGMSNWLLSVQRADRVRQRLSADEAIAARLARIEGTADRELRVEANPLSGRNRRISITLLYAA
ncbi:MAG: flagellar motor protein MotB [Pacificimonas sp.]